MPSMPSPHTPGSRDRALARLRRLTIGSILGSVLALGGFATAAGLSYSGSAAPQAATPPTTAPTAAPATTTAPTPVSTPTPTPTPWIFPGSGQPGAHTRAS